jgi:hypothetical protein
MGSRGETRARGELVRYMIRGEADDGEVRATLAGEPHRSSSYFFFLFLFKTMSFLGAFLN